MPDVEQPPTETDTPTATVDDWDGIVSDGVTLVATDATPEQIAKTLGVELKPAVTPSEKPGPVVAPPEAVAAKEPPTAAPKKKPEEKPEERPKGKSLEARIAQARFDLREAERRERATVQRAQELEAQLAEARAATPKPEPVAKSAGPSETFASWELWSQDPAHEDATYEDYMDARADWRAVAKGFISREEAERLATDKAQELRAQEREEEAVAHAARDADARRLAFLTAREAARTKHEDYVQVVEETDLPTNPVMDEYIKRAGPLAGELMYHLGSHPEDCQRIAALRTPAEVIKAMTRIELTLEGASVTGPPPSGEPVTRAPAPPEPVGGARSASPAVSLADPRLSIHDFMRIRNEAERANAGRY